jgi:hypothetical protein
MNIELLKKVAEWLEAGAPHQQTGGMGFDMRYFGVTNGCFNNPPSWITPECGSVGCIAGAVNQFSGVNIFTGDANTAFKALGVYDEELQDKLHTLFYPEEYEDAWYAPPEKVAKVVRHFIKTKEVDWELALED